jgi:L-aminopeptidase/D-esterase-like protein
MTTADQSDSRRNGGVLTINGAPVGRELGNEAMSPLFQEVVEATEEAIYNSLLRATTATGRAGHRVEALPIDKVVEMLRKYGAIK